MVKYYVNMAKTTQQVMQDYYDQQIADRRAQSRQRMSDAMQQYNDSGRNPLGAYIKQNQQEQQINEQRLRNEERSAKLQSINNMFTALGNSIAAFGGVRTSAPNEFGLYRSLNNADALREKGRNLRQTLAELLGKEVERVREGNLRQAQYEMQQADADYNNMISQRRWESEQQYKKQKAEADQLYKKQKDELDEQRYYQDLVFRKWNADENRRQQASLTAIREAGADRRAAADKASKQSRINITLHNKNGNTDNKSTVLTNDMRNDMDVFIHKNLEASGELGKIISAYHRGTDGNLNNVRMTIKNDAEYSEIYPFWAASLNPQEQLLLQMKAFSEDRSRINGEEDIPTEKELQQQFGKSYPNWKSFAQRIGLKYSK